MELVILKARAQLNRLVSSGEKRSGSSERSPRGEGGGESARAAGRGRNNMAPPAPSSWLNASLTYNLSRLNTTFDTDYELLNATAGDDQNNHWFCAKWTSAQQDLFQVIA